MKREFTLFCLLIAISICIKDQVVGGIHKPMAGGYCLDQVGDKMVAGNFGKPGPSDIVAFYKHEMENTRSHRFQNNHGNGCEGLIYSGGMGSLKVRIGETEYSKTLENEILVHPNPSYDYFNVTYTLKEPSKIKLTVYSFFGEILLEILDEKEEGGHYNTGIPWNEIGNQEIVIVRLQSAEFTSYKKVFRKN